MHLLLQVLFTIRSERLLMEELDYNLLYRWFVGLEMDDPVWNPRSSRRHAKSVPQPEVGVATARQSARK